MSAIMSVDMAGAQIGGAARYAADLRDYLARIGRRNVRVMEAAGEDQ